MTTVPHRPLRALVLVSCAAFLLAFAGSQLASGAKSDASKAKTFHDQAITKTDKPTNAGGEKIKLAFKNDGDGVGNADFPNCEGTGTSVDCGGTVSLDHLGNKLSTIVVWNCPPQPPFTCDPGKGRLDTTGGKEVGTITLKVQPDDIKKGKRFPAVVKKIAPH